MNPTLKEALRSGEIELRGIHRNKEYKELSPQLEKTIEEQRLMLEEALGFDLGIHKILLNYYPKELGAVLKYNKKFNEKLNLRTEGEVLEEMQKIITLFKSKKIKLNVKDLSKTALYLDYEYLKNLFEEFKELDEGIIKYEVKGYKNPEAKLENNRKNRRT